MTNNKMSLGQKVGVSLVAWGLAGIIGATITSDFGYMKKYSTLTEANAIATQLDSLKSDKLLVEDVSLEGKYSVFKEEYTAKLEDRLKFIQSSNQYNTEKQKSEEDRNSLSNHAILTLLSLLLAVAGAVVYDFNYPKIMTLTIRRER